MKVIIRGKDALNLFLGLSKEEKRKLKEKYNLNGREIYQIKKALENGRWSILKNLNYRESSSSADI